ncbi:MAG: hypothetical protein KC589_01730, partial [Nanoarchaeota archaeon]|nr:hypothetical protein [Nanoarchaeota archaeon]
IENSVPLLIKFFVVISPVISVFLIMSAILYFILKYKHVKKRYLKDMKILILILIIILIIMVLSVEFYYNYFAFKGGYLLTRC